jgi:hypothetical protein
MLSKYSDASDSALYAKGSIASCLETQVVSGRADGTLSPKSYITRAEVAAIMQRMLKKSELI